MSRVSCCERSSDDKDTNTAKKTKNCFNDNLSSQHCSPSPRNGNSVLDLLFSQSTYPAKAAALQLEKLSLMALQPPPLGLVKACTFHYGEHLTGTTMCDAHDMPWVVRSLENFLTDKREPGCMFCIVYVHLTGKQGKYHTESKCKHANPFTMTGDKVKCMWSQSRFKVNSRNPLPWFTVTVTTFTTSFCTWFSITNCRAVFQDTKQFAHLKHGAASPINFHFN